MQDPAEPFDPSAWRLTARTLQIDRIKAESEARSIAREAVRQVLKCLDPVEARGQLQAERGVALRAGCDVSKLEPATRMLDAIERLRAAAERWSSEAAPVYDAELIGGFRSLLANLPIASRETLSVLDYVSGVSGGLTDVGRYKVASAHEYVCRLAGEVHEATAQALCVGRFLAVRSSEDDGLDRTNRDILAAVASGRSSSAAIGEVVGMSAEGVRTRMRDLKARGWVETVKRQYELTSRGREIAASLD